MAVPHIDWSVAVGVAGGIIGAAGVFRTAKLNALKTDVDLLSRKVADLTKETSTLEVRCETLNDGLKRAEEKALEQYTARIGVLEENRELRKLVQERDETIIQQQRKIIEAPKTPRRSL